MGGELIIAFVGKPSAGKSTFLNAVSDASAKTGNFPFTTIEPNHGVAYYSTRCPCVRFKEGGGGGSTSSSCCTPRYGTCRGGMRCVPVKIMDVAGLVPGAHLGKGLGNKFLDDLRHASVLVHVVDVSGTTNEKGEVSSGYDPISDIEWLRCEIHNWIFGNLAKKWTSIVRRHVATKSTLTATLKLQFSGYGASGCTVSRAVDRCRYRNLPLEQWSEEEELKEMVAMFVEERFPMVYALNKIDLPQADRNIERLCKKYDNDRIVCSSAIGECMLRKLRKQKFIAYEDGAEDFQTSEDDPSLGLKPLDEKIKGRLEKLRDLVLFRYGGTGTSDVIRRAVDIAGYIPVFPVRNIYTLQQKYRQEQHQQQKSNPAPPPTPPPAAAAGSSTTSASASEVFPECLLVAPNTSMKELAHVVSPELEKFYSYAEGLNGQRLGEDAIVTSDNNIISFKTTPQSS
eukprot:Nk52_evm1s2099 gene=Nk52_evmTU1s2099